MPSKALIGWQAERTPRLSNIDTDCSHLAGLHAADPGRVQEFIRRFLIPFWPTVIALDPAHAARQHRLAMLNAWRNAIAHNDYDPTQLGGTIILTILQVRDWRTDCEAFAMSFDAVMRNYLHATTGVLPWSP